MGLFHSVVREYLVLFAIVNAFGNLPILWELTRDMDRAAKARCYRTAAAVACAIVVAFALVGDWVLREAFQVDVNAFRIAGGILVFAVAARGVLQVPRTQPKAHELDEDVALFPMAFPFLAGPGTIVTTILLMQAEGCPRTAAQVTLSRNCPECRRPRRQRPWPQ